MDWQVSIFFFFSAFLVFLRKRHRNNVRRMGVCNWFMIDSLLLLSEWVFNRNCACLCMCVCLCGCVCRKTTYDVLLFGMRSNVFGQMIAAHEFLTAFGALETFFPGVGSTMSLQFIGTRKTFAALRPRANKRAFTYCVNRIELIHFVANDFSVTAVRFHRETCLCANANVPADATFCHTLCCIQRCGICAAAYGPNAVRLPRNSGRYRRHALSAASDAHLRSHLCSHSLRSGSVAPLCSCSLSDL